MKRIWLVTLAAGAALVLPATSALAHVTVNPREAAGGSYAKLAFRVPNERDNAATTKLEINFPADHPFASVSVRPQAGWTYKVDKTTLATPIKVHDNDVSEVVSKVTWTGGEIKAGEFNEFEVSVGPLPSDAESITFKALQTYSNGEVVRWIEEATGSSEPEHPAPVLKLTSAASPATTATTAPASEAQGGQVAESDAASKSDVDTARTFGILGMAFGLLGFVSAVVARRKRPSAS